MDRFVRILARISFISLSVIAFGCSGEDRYVTISGHAQGGTYTVKLNLNGRDGMIGMSAEAVRDSVDAILQDIDNALSGYNRNSLLSRFNAGEAVVPDSLFIDMYLHARRVYDMTCGAVDAASAPLYDIWGFGFTDDEMPSDEKVGQMLSISGMGRLKEDIRGAICSGGVLEPAALLVSEADTVLPRLNYNAIAQGYSCDMVARYLYSIGVKDMMVEIGEIFCDGKNPKGCPWTIGIDSPADGNNAPGARVHGIFRVPEGPHGVVTSGNYRKFYMRGGKKYSHTVDPRTGYPVSHPLLSATIVAPDGMLADAYATYCMVIGLEDSMKFISSSPEIEGCLIYDDNGIFRTWCSDGFSLEQM